MGQVKTQITITNRLDEGMAERGVLPADQVRRITLDNVLADTGATHLCLPAEIIQQLGLSPLKQVLTSTAAGYQKTTVYQDAKVSIQGREGIFQCVELPGGEHPLLGVIPMEDLGLELDLQKQQMRLLPMEPGNTYVMIYANRLTHEPPAEER
ncbi:MAG: aspartyl protease family protein [Acidobacteria bacterium]|nr:aspartyl protease family protein [Acidobacteriota bacterium]MBI3425769.1 aspartyl protease family protein [Acidobacteriota bacterium]